MLAGIFGPVGKANIPSWKRVYYSSAMQMKIKTIQGALSKEFSNENMIDEL